MPVPALSLQSLARGLWCGLEPEEVRLLTWAERRVLRLARTYATVKRVLSSCVAWARENFDARPQYTTRNVVSYPQDPATTVACVCLWPADFAKDVCVQFEGSDRSVVAAAEDLRIGVDRLRAAL